MAYRLAAFDFDGTLADSFHYFLANVNALARKHGCGMECITLGNGSNDVLVMIAEAFLTPQSEAVYSQYGFAVYPIAVQATGATARVAPANPDSHAMPLGHDLDAMAKLIGPATRVVLVANPKDNYPVGGGRTINGGLNSGGGFMFIASSELRRNKHFQATLQHELGHAFGLPHPDVYGYDLRANPSIMSYNPANFTDGFRPSRRPGVLIPEDRRALALNKRVFAKATFDPARDLPKGYKLFPKVVPLGPR